MKSPAQGLNHIKTTLYFILFFVEDLEVLLESFLCFLAFGVVLLQILAKVNKMDLYFEIPFSDVFLFGLEVFLVPVDRRESTS
jgi:hypothetical protein